MPRVTAGAWRARVCGSKRGSRAHDARRHGRWREAESPEEDFALGHFQRSATLKRDPAGGACVLERASQSARWLRRKRGQRRGLRGVVTRQGCARTRTHACAHAHTNRRSNTDVLERPPAKHQCFTACTRSPRPGEEAASRRTVAGTVRRACKRARAGGGGPSGWGVFSRGSTLGKYSLALTAAYKRPLHSAHRKMSFQE